jgi:short-subunit dehydrogenase
MAKSRKFVLVTGAANGIGLAITEYLAKKGDFVIASDIDEENLNRLKGRENIATVYLDVRNSESISKAVEEIRKITDGLDVLINNAGVFVGGPLLEVSEQDLAEILKVNVIGVHKVTKLVFPLLKKNSRIINIGSETGRIAFPMNGPYSMSKFALEAFSDSLRRELMFLDMKVILFQVGAMNTSMLDRTYCCYAEEIDIEKTLFPKLVSSVISACEKEQRKSGDPSLVGKKVYKVIHKRRPKARYKIRNSKLRRMVEFLPDSLIDSAIKNMFK